MRDFLPSEMAIAIGVALLVQGGAGVALRMANVNQADTPEIDKGAATPVRVIPVIDEELPALKLGGKKVKYKLPDKWLKQTPPAPLAEQKAHVSTKADKTEQGIPDKDLKLAEADAAAPPPDADLAKQVDTPITELSDAAPSNIDTEGHASGTKDGTETDPLKARAVDQWRSRIASWFQKGFSCASIGLPEEEMKKLRVSATVQIPGGTVASYSMGSSGNPQVDAAARARLDAAKGNSIPPKPENYPDIQLNQINVTLVCK